MPPPGRYRFDAEVRALAPGLRGRAARFHAEAPSPKGGPLPPAVGRAHRLNWLLEWPVVAAVLALVLLAWEVRPRRPGPRAA